MMNQVITWRAKIKTDVFVKTRRCAAYKNTESNMFAGLKKNTLSND